MLRSYTRAIQKQQKITGSLFQKETKAICLTQVEGVTPAWFQSEYGAIINIPLPKKAYPQVCFEYIHTNPVKNGLVTNAEDWEFSSVRGYLNDDNNILVNKKRARGLELKSLGLTLK